MRSAEVRVGDAVPALAAAVSGVLGASWWQVPDADVRGAVVELERQAARLEAARLRLLAEADARRIGAVVGAACTADWLVAETGTRRERAGERVALAGALNGPLAVTGAALAAGDLGVEHALVVHRAMGRLDASLDPATRAEAERFLVGQAGSLDPRQLAHVARALRHRLSPDAGADLAREEDTAVAAREVRCTQTDEGTWLLSGVLDAVGGATLAAALDPLSAPEPARIGLPDRRSAARRRADALVQLAEHSLAPPTATESARPRLVVSVPVDTLQHPTGPGVAPGLLDGGAPVSASTVGVLACDAEVVPVLVGADGSPLDVGRTVYAFPTLIRRAILARDRGCTFPTCTRPVGWCQAHHLTAYSAGGSTSERNGTALCGYHHRLVHRQGWRGELIGAQVTWHPPDRSSPRVPPPPWLPALDRLTQTWAQRQHPHAA